MRYLYALLGLAVLLNAALAAAGTFNVNMNVATYVDAANPNANFSVNNDTLWAVSTGGKPVKEVFLTFENNFASPAGVFNPDKISSATLKLNAKNLSKPGTIKAYFVHGPIMKTVTWNDKLEYNNSVSASLGIQKVGEYPMDVTPVIKEAVKACAEGCPYTIVLAADGNASIGFSKDDGQKPSLDFTTID